MSWPAHEAYLTAGCVLANYALTQVFSWMEVRALREVYDRQVREIEKLERDRVFVRRLHVSGEPGKPLRIGKSHEDGTPAPVTEFEWLRSEALELVDDAGRRFALEEDVSLYVSHLAGGRKLFDVDNAGERFDFTITPEQSFYMLMTDAGPYPIARAGSYGSPYHHLTTRPSDFEREVTPRGAFPAWIVLPLMAALFLASHYWLLPDELEGRIGLIMLTFGMWLFVCLSEAPFALPVPRHKTRLPVRRWKPEPG